MKIEKKQIRYNYSVRKDKIKYIVIHDTGNPSAYADADAHFNYFNGGNRGSSADVFVDDSKCLIVNDYTKYYTWHCGDGKGKYGITNSNSVGIEMCINSDGDYDKALSNMVEFTKQLMAELNIPPERVLRHYDASRKLCPYTFSIDGWGVWDRFKDRISDNKEELTMTQYEELKNEISDLTETVKILATELYDVKNPMMYNYIDENTAKISADANDALKAAVNKGILKGADTGLNLTEDMIRIHIWNYRMGLYD